jgi:hypothetical protein
MIESQEFLNSTDVFVSTLRGFETVDQSLQVEILAVHEQTPRTVLMGLVVKLGTHVRFWVT